MLSKLPRWVWSFAWMLAFGAGVINVVGVLGFEHQAITHLTGTTSYLGAAIAHGDTSGVRHFLAIIGCFVLGAAVSGAIIQDSTLKLGRRYGVVLILEAIILVIAVPLLHHQNSIGTYLAGVACGLQNAMASTYSGTVIRTSHVTGMFTDLGIFLGHALRGAPIAKRRLQLCLLIISGFLIGGVIGGLAFPLFEYSALYIPAAIAGFSAITYGIYRGKHGLEE